MLKQLKAEIHERLKVLCRDGDSYASKGMFDLAISKYEQALEFIPEPLSDWEASLWVLAALGQVYVSKGDYIQALVPLSAAMNCGGVGNPYLHLLMGKAQLEMGFDILASDELARAYMAGGREIFDGENPKYFEFLKTYLNEPPGGWN